MREKTVATGRVEAVEEDEQDEAAAEVPLDIAVAEPLTWKSFGQIVSKSYTWLPALMYATTFGFELGVDANLANVLVSDHKGLGQLKAGYCKLAFHLFLPLRCPLQRLTDPSLVPQQTLRLSVSSMFSQDLSEAGWETKSTPRNDSEEFEPRNISRSFSDSYKVPCHWPTVS